MHLRTFREMTPIKVILSSHVILSLLNLVTLLTLLMIAGLT